LGCLDNSPDPLDKLENFMKQKKNILVMFRDISGKWWTRETIYFVLKYFVPMATAFDSLQVYCDLEHTVYNFCTFM